MVILTPNVVPFPEVKTDGFLRQAALDIIFILINTSSITTINLEAGDATRNTLFKISQALQRVTTIPNLPKEPSLHPSTDPTQRHTQVPRVPVNTIPKEISLHPSQVPRVPVNTRQWTKGVEPFKQTQYNLRPR